jgi:hypothetical protein
MLLKSFSIFCMEGDPPNPQTPPFFIYFFIFSTQNICILSKLGEKKNEKGGLGGLPPTKK